MSDDERGGRDRSRSPARNRSPPREEAPRREERGEEPSKLFIGNLSFDVRYLVCEV